MANKIQFEITVDDKGAVKTFRQIGDEAKKTGTDSQKAFAGASDSIQKNWLAMTAAVGAAMLGVHKTIQLLGHGAKEKQVEEAFHNVAKSYGQDADKIVAAMHRATAGTINGSDLMQKAIKGMTQDLSGTDMVKIAEMARVAARTTGEDVSAMFDRISDAIANQTPRALRQLGLVSKEELKVLEDAVAAGIEGVNLLDLAFIQATKSGEAMGGMAKNDAEYFQELKAIGSEMYDALSQGALAYAKSLATLGQSDMSYAGLSPAGMGTGRQADPKASEQSVSAEQRKKGILDKIKAETKAAKDRENALKNEPKLAADRKKAAEDEAAVYTEMFGNSVKAYTYEIEMGERVATEKDENFKKLMSQIDAGFRAEQEKSEILGQMAMVDQQIAEGSAKDRADAYRTMYSDMQGDAQQYYTFQLKALGKERDNYEKLTGDKVLADKWYLNQKKKFDQDLALSSNKFFKGVGVGYDRMLDDQMTWAKGGLAIFKSFAKSSQSTLSNVLFDGWKKDLKSFDDYFDSFCDGLVRTLTDTVAEMATQQVAKSAASGLASIGGWVGGAALDWLGESGAGSAALDWMGGDWDWLASLHTGAYYVGQDQTEGDSLKQNEFLRILERGEAVIPKGIADDARSGDYSGLIGFMGGTAAGASFAQFSGTTSVNPAIASAFNSSVLGIGGFQGGKGLAGLGAGMSISQALGMAMQGALSGVIGLGFNTALDAIMDSLGFETGTTASGYGKGLGSFGGGIFGGVPGSILGGVLGNLAGYAINALNETTGLFGGGYGAGGFGYGSGFSISNDRGWGGGDGGFGGGSIGSGFSGGPDSGYGGGDGGFGGGYRYGGISEGPDTGYPITVHGREAHVPLPNGKSIPVKISGSGDSGNLPPVQVNVVIDRRVLASVLYKQSKAGVKIIHNRGLTNV